MILLKVIVWCLLLLVTYYVLDVSAGGDAHDTYYTALVDTCAIRDPARVLAVLPPAEALGPVLNALYAACASLVQSLTASLSALYSGTAEPSAAVDSAAVLSSIVVNSDLLLALSWEYALKLMLNLSCVVHSFLQLNMRITS